MSRSARWQGWLNRTGLLAIEVTLQPILMSCALIPAMLPLLLCLSLGPGGPSHCKSFSGNRGDKGQSYSPLLF